MSTGLVIAIIVISLVCLGLSIGLGVYVARKRAADKEAADKEASDKADMEKAAADKEAAEKEAAEKEAAEKEAAEKADADKAAAEKAAAEKRKVCLARTLDLVKQETTRYPLLNAMRPQHKKKWMAEIDKLLKKLEDPVCACFESLSNDFYKLQNCISEKLDWKHFDDTVSFAIADISSADTKNDIMDINYDHPELIPSDAMLKNAGQIAQCIYNKIKEDYPMPNDLLIEMQSMQNNNITGRNRLKNIIRGYLKNCFVNQDMCTKKLIFDYINKVVPEGKSAEPDIKRMEMLCKGEIPPGMFEPQIQAQPVQPVQISQAAQPVQIQPIQTTQTTTSAQPTKVEGFTDISKLPSFSNYKPFVNQDGYVQLRPTGPAPDLTQLNNSIQGYSEFDFQNRTSIYRYN